MRPGKRAHPAAAPPEFPFLFGGTFIEAPDSDMSEAVLRLFPFLFGGTFIEAYSKRAPAISTAQISLPFRRDFH